MVYYCYIRDWQLALLLSSYLALRIDREINKQHTYQLLFLQPTMESPTKTIRPLELHSPSNSNIDDNTPSPNDGKGSAMKGTTPSSSSVVAPLPPRLPDDDDNNENENRHTTTTNDDDEDGRYEHPFYLSPIGRMDLGTPSTAATGTNNDMTLETQNNNNTARREEEEEVNESFPDNRDETIEIHSSANYNDNDYSNETDSLIGDLDDVLNEMNGTAAEENQDDAEDVYDENEEEEEEEDDNHDEEEEEEEEETEEERMQREIEESEALARQLMGKKEDSIVVVFYSKLVCIDA